MKISMLKLLGACALSVLAYAVVGGFIVDKPVSYGSIEPMFQKKLAYGYSQPSPKLVIIAGSNARTSHRCAELEASLGLPCVNGGNTAGLGLSYVFERFEPIVKAGDVVYLPLEYQQYLTGKSEALTGPDAAILLRHDKAGLLRRGPEGVLRAVFIPDIGYLVDGLVEMGLHAAGLKARFDTKAFDAQGDEIGLTHERGRQYAAFIARNRWAPPTAAAFGGAHGSKEIIAAFIKECRARGARVIGGLPVSFDDVALPDDLVAAIRAWYLEQGAEFLELPGRSRYPRDHFYDSPFHLDEEMTLQHTAILADGLRPMLQREIEAAKAGHQTGAP
jgi:hypothetical protein